MSENFEIAFKHILEVEGGFVNDSSDHGGPTNFGITHKTLSDFLGHSVTEEDVRSIDISVVKQIYKKNYWDRLRLDFVNYAPLAFFMFDQAVNRGTRKVAEQIQEQLKVQVDGIIGPKTLQAINDLQNPHGLLLSFLKASQNSYIRIVQADPTQIKYLKAWIGRTHKFLT